MNPKWRAVAKFTTYLLALIKFGIAEDISLSDAQPTNVVMETNHVTIKWTNNVEENIHVVKRPKGSGLLCSYKSLNRGTGVLVTGRCQSGNYTIQIHHPSHGSFLVSTRNAKVIKVIDNTNDFKSSRLTKRSEVEDYMQVLPPKFYLPISFYFSPSWETASANDAATRFEEIIAHVKYIFQHESLATSFIIDEELQDFQSYIYCSNFGLKRFQSNIPTNKTVTKGRVHIALTNCFSLSGERGRAELGTLCDPNNTLSSGLVGWQDDDLDLIQVMAHEIGHILGMEHDFETNQDDVTLTRTFTCGKPKWEGGDGNFLMNYGSPRKSAWSKCSNHDFVNYYKEVLAKDGTFCLSETPIEGWSSWTEWSGCHSWSLNGMQFRTRLCEGGNACEGINLEERNCTKETSDVVENIVTLLTDFWSDWSSWSNCTKACGIGSRTRTRTCKSLFKRNESDCKHLDHREEVELCNQQECSLSKWSSWEDWSSCSQSCGSGIQTRMRKCKEVSCIGVAKVDRVCNQEPCFDSCSKQVFVSMKGRAFNDQSSQSGIYSLSENGTYWVKKRNSSITSIDHAIWYDYEKMGWAIGYLSGVGTSLSQALVSYNGSSCPESGGNLWFFFNGERFVASNGNVQVSAWSPDICNEDYVFMALQGRSSEIQQTSAGMYDRVSNETMVYWTKESANASNGQAIWFDQTYGTWRLGQLANLGSNLNYLTSTSSPICPYASDTEWSYFDGTEQVEENLDSIITLTPWKIGSCSSEYLFISLNGRAWNERGFVAGFYQKIVNSSTVYWLKEEDEVPTAIWFSQSHGKWIVGRLDDLGGTAGYLFSSGSTICPDSPGIEWTYGDGTGEFTIARNTINVSKWTEGACSRQIQVKLKGRIYQEHSIRSGVYNIVLNQTYPYWIKDENAIWFDKANGFWLIGLQDYLNQSNGWLHTTSAPMCPHTPGTEWKAYYNSEWTDAFDSVEVTEIIDESFTVIPPK